MKLEEIKQELKGYFIYRYGRGQTLALRDNDNFKLFTEEIEYRTIKEQYKISPMYYLVMQINNQLLDPTIHIKGLSEVLPIIDFKVFDDYDSRNLEIENHKQLLNQIKESKSIFGRKKDFKLIYVKKPKSNIYSDTPIDYYVIKDNEVVPIDKSLIDDVKNAIGVISLDEVKKALKEDFTNRYDNNYKRELDKWNSLI